jgi:glycosyltransferase involved in cell wall biosynthesis
LSDAGVTVVFLLYNAERAVPMLVAALARQRHPRIERQSEWLEALFVDDCSRDGTAAVLARCLEERGSPSNWRSIRNERNLGLAATLNLAFGAVRTPFALSCHCDCEFGTDTYVAEALELVESRPRAAAVTGKPTLPPGRELPFAERVNLIANLMDVLPPESDAALVPVGFAEGRCDIFRLAALREVGFYDTTLRTAGEDQVLAARLRRSGYEVLQAPHLPYFLSVSDEQDTISKLLRHQRLFGRAHPYILLRTRRAGHGVAGPAAGANRRSRLLLRVQQLAATFTLLGCATALLLGSSPLLPAAALALLLAVKVALFRRHLRIVPLRGLEWIAFALLQPALDASYSLGLAQGLVAAAAGSPARPID